MKERLKEEELKGKERVGSWGVTSLKTLKF